MIGVLLWSMLAAGDARVGEPTADVAREPSVDLDGLLQRVRVAEDLLAPMPEERFTITGRDHRHAMRRGIRLLPKEGLEVIFPHITQRHEHGRPMTDSK